MNKTSSSEALWLSSLIPPPPPFIYAILTFRNSSTDCLFTYCYISLASGTCMFRAKKEASVYPSSESAGGKLIVQPRRARIGNRTHNQDIDMQNGSQDHMTKA